MSTEDPETYLRRFAETQLRRLAAGEVTAAECAARVDSVAVAFEETGVLDGQATARASDDLHLALAVRSPGRGASRWRTQLSSLRTLQGPGHGIRSTLRKYERNLAPEDVRVTPVGAVLRPRGDDGDEDIYLLAYISLPERAWFNVAAHTSEPLVPRRHASPPSARNPRALQSTRYRPTFAGSGMTANDDAGRTYDLRFSGGGDKWYLGRLTLNSVPPPETAWLDVHCGGETARIDLRTAPPAAEVTIRPLPARRGENYLLRQAESLPGSPATGTGLLTVKATALSIAVTALRATGLLPTGSPVPGQVAALIEGLGGPGSLIAEPEKLPERWAALMAGGSQGDDSEPVAAASLAAVLPEVDGVSVHLAGLVNVPGLGTKLFGWLRTDTDLRGQTFWLRDDAGTWHTVVMRHGLGLGPDYQFQASVWPPVGPSVSRIEFSMTGPETEVRAVIPVNWWTS